PDGGGPQCAGHPALREGGVPHLRHRPPLPVRERSIYRRTHDGALPRRGTRKVKTMSDTNFSPREIVSELDRNIVGQNDAKRAVAVALRNRWRRQQLSEELRAEVTPKNILMIGPTGVGKTEISRRLARLAQAPFI